MEDQEKLQNGRISPEEARAILERREQEDKAACIAEVQEVLGKWGFQLYPVMTVTPERIIPSIDFVRVKGQRTNPQ